MQSGRLAFPGFAFLEEDALELAPELCFPLPLPFLFLLVGRAFAAAWESLCDSRDGVRREPHIEEALDEVLDVDLDGAGVLRKVRF